ncbi:hypothetical protein C0J52_15532 [Blattella germanica]|nr:hypothetical protein C0J52_15532 [Blattella germanica]
MKSKGEMQHVGMNSILQKWRAVGHVMFTKHLFLTNVGISLSLSGLGDVIQQHYEIMQGEQQRWDRRRTLQMSVTGMTIGVFCHHTYKILDKFFPGRTLRTVLKKVLVDQVVTSPLCITIFFGTLACLERSSLENFVKEMKEKGWRLYVADWVVWPPAQMINFYLLPTKYRVLYDNTISLGYDVYTSYVAHDKSDR